MSHNSQLSKHGSVGFALLAEAFVGRVAGPPVCPHVHLGGTILSCVRSASRGDVHASCPLSAILHGGVCRQSCVIYIFQNPPHVEKPHSSVEVRSLPLCPMGIECRDIWCIAEGQHCAEVDDSVCCQLCAHCRGDISEWQLPLKHVSIMYAIALHCFEGCPDTHTTHQNAIMTPEVTTANQNAIATSGLAQNTHPNRPTTDHRPQN